MIIKIFKGNLHVAEVIVVAEPVAEHTEPFERICQIYNKNDQNAPWENVTLGRSFVESSESTVFKIISVKRILKRFLPLMKRMQIEFRTSKSIKVLLL